MKNKIFYLAIFLVMSSFQMATANYISATPANYTTFLSSLKAGDTLFLEAGNYLNRLNLNNKSGTATDPIVIMGSGNTTIFLANACCNTVDITNVAYIVFRDFMIDGQHINYVDGVKAGGGGNTFAHHITLENLTIVNNGGSIVGDNQTVGISTKCAAWNWAIRGCTIIAAGTGIYLGNSDGTCPFVSGLIENNLVINTRGYNMQIKAQKDNVRQIFPETSNDSQTTIIRYNVWSKETGSTLIGEGDGSRPCLLMDNFPTTGFGAHDHYEVYGNFFYENPTEALMQVTGNTTAYNNIFVNHVAPSGYPPVVMNSHNGFPPREMNFFHNTVLTNSDEAGIGLYGANSNYEQYCYANAVFSNGNPIVGFKPANSIDNILDSYSNAANYIHSPSTTLSSLDVYPLPGQLQGSQANDALFTRYTDYDIDFNGVVYDGTFRGAYSGEGVNPGWKLQLDIRPTPPRDTTMTGLNENYGRPDFAGILYPNPTTNSIQLSLASAHNAHAEICLMDVRGNLLQTLFSGEILQGNNTITASIQDISPGFYLVKISTAGRTMTKKVLVQHGQ